MGASGGAGALLHDGRGAGGEIASARQAAPDPYVHRDQPDSPEIQAEEIAGAGSGRGGSGGGTGAAARGRCGVFGGGRSPHGARVSGKDFESGGSGRRTDGEYSRYR